MTPCKPGTLTERWKMMVALPQRTAWYSHTICKIFSLSLSLLLSSKKTRPDHLILASADHIATSKFAACLYTSSNARIIDKESGGIRSLHLYVYQSSCQILFLFFIKLFWYRAPLQGQIPFRLQRQHHLKQEGRQKETLSRLGIAG